jgi:hypothetical protein
VSPDARHRLLTWSGGIVVAAFAVGFVVANHTELPAAWRTARHADGWWLAAIVALSLAGLVNHSRLHAEAQRAAGVALAAGPALRLSCAAFFLNMVTKSGGMAGMAPFVADARRRGRGRGPTVAGYVLASVLGELAFALTLAVALVVVASDGRLTRGELVAGAAFTALLTVRLATVVAALRSRAAVRRVYGWPRRIAATVRRRPPAPADHEAADELHDALHLLRRRPRALAPAVVHALLVEVLGIAMLAAALAAVHSPHGVGEALVAYAVSVLFAIVGFLPGGLGFVEASLGAVLVSFGSPVAEATATVALYRIGELWLPLALGAVAARLKGAG